MRTVTVIFLLVFSGAANSAIIMQPYLMGVQANSVWVLIECSTADTVMVDFGTTPSYGSTARTFMTNVTTNTTYVHKIYVTGLNENTVYYYRARQLSSISGGYSFVTAPNEGTSFRFLWIGDYRSGKAVHDQICQLVPQYNPRFYLNGGDVAVSGSYADFKDEFFRPGELNIISQIPFFLTVGNHEDWDTNTRAFTKGLTTGSGTEDYYSFDYGNMHVLVLNNMVDYSIGSSQYNFAMADLGSTSKTWKIVISHYPAYCSGGHGEDEGMIAMSQNIFVPKGVDMVISGHSHFYQHNRVSGIEHMVLGGGGAPLYDPTDASYTIRSVKDYNFGIVDVTGTTFLMKVYNNINVLIDTVRIVKNPSGLNENRAAPSGFSIVEVYPNPSNPGFTVSFNVRVESDYKLELFSMTGKKIDSIREGRLSAGHHEAFLKTDNLPSGVYFVVLTDGKDFDSIKIAVVK